MNFAGIEEKAVASGASSCFVEDLREAFVEEVIWPTLRSGALYESVYLLGTAMARPIIARGQVQHARRVGADGLCHGCTGKGNDQVRFEATFAALAPDLVIIAPWREWGYNSREELIEFCHAKGVPVTSSAEKIYSRDRNLWHISHEGGAIEDIGLRPSPDAWMLTAEPAEAPDEPEYLTVAFQRGTPVAVNGQRMSGVSLIEHLNAIAGRHGVGRIDMVENRVVGMKSRGLYETPGGHGPLRSTAGAGRHCSRRTKPASSSRSSVWNSPSWSMQANGGGRHVRRSLLPPMSFLATRLGRSKSDSTREPLPPRHAALCGVCTKKTSPASRRANSTIRPTPAAFSGCSTCPKASARLMSGLHHDR